MELLDVTLTCLQRRNRAAFVRRAELDASVRLIPGQKVVLRDEEGEYFAGTVVDEMGAGEESRFLLNVGVRLPEEYALRRLDAGRVPAPRDDMDSLLDLLGEARALMNPRPIPAQRTAR